MYEVNKLHSLLDQIGLFNDRDSIKTAYLFKNRVFIPMLRDGTQRSLDNEEFFITAFEINHNGEIAREIAPQKVYGEVAPRKSVNRIVYDRFSFAKSGKHGNRLKSTIALQNPKGYGLFVCESMFQAERIYNHLLMKAADDIKEIIGKLEEKRNEITGKIIT